MLLRMHLSFVVIRPLTPLFLLPITVDAIKYDDGVEKIVPINDNESLCEYDVIIVCRRCRRGCENLHVYKSE